MVKGHYHNKGSSGASIGRYCCLLSFLSLTLTTLTATILVILFVLKPKKPIFQLHSIQLDSFNLLIPSTTKEAHVSPPMVSLLFVTQNPNKLGIRYTSSEFAILCESIPVGVAEVPTFYQPPRSADVTVLMHASFDRHELVRFLEGESRCGFSNNGGRVEIGVVGCVGVVVHVMNFPLPKIKVALDCRIDLNYADMISSKGVNFIKPQKALLLSNNPHLSQKCSLALCI